MSSIKDIGKSVDIKHMYVGLDENGTVLDKVKIKYTIDLLLSSYLRWILTQVTWANVRKEPKGTKGKR